MHFRCMDSNGYSNAWKGKRKYAHKFKGMPLLSKNLPKPNYIPRKSMSDAN